MHSHPIELALYGYSNSGKTTLLEKVLKNLGTRYDIGYIKNNAHSFQMDHDFVLIEASRSSNIKKIVFCDDDGTIFENFKDHENILALIYKNESQFGNIPLELKDKPLFHRDQSDEVSSFIEKHVKEMVGRPLKGLVLVGGKSKRMGRDKFELNYHEKTPHYQFTYQLLQQFCEEVFVSCRSDQAEEFSSQGFSTLEDTFLDLGPTSGILSALKSDRSSDWLVLACDLPMIDEKIMKELIKLHDPLKTATAYLNQSQSRIEPLCAIYTPKSYPGLLSMIESGYHCPQKFLWNASINAIPLTFPEQLANANTPEDYQSYKSRLQQETCK